MSTKLKPTLIAMILLASLLYISQSTSLESNLIPKEIDAQGDSLTTQTFFETNEPGLYQYQFQLMTKTLLKFSIISKDGQKGEGVVRLFRIENGTEIPMDEISLTQDNSTEINFEQEEETLYYLEYEYSKTNSILMKFCHLGKEIYLLDEYNGQELFYYDNQTLYFLVFSYGQEENYNIPVKVTANFEIVDEKISFIDSYFPEIGKDEYAIVEKLINDLDNNPSNYAEMKKLDNNTIIYYHPAQEIMFSIFKVQTTDNKINNIQPIRISFIAKKEMDNSNLSPLLSKKNYYSGNLCYINVTENRQDNISYLLYTNVSSIMEIILTNEENAKNYKFGDSSSVKGETILNDQLTLINNFDESVEIIIVAIINPKEDYFFRIIPLINSSISVNSLPFRTERVTLLNNHKDLAYDFTAVINKYERQGEKYVQFIDYFLGYQAGENYPKYLDLDDPEQIEERDWINPIRTKSKNELIILKENAEKVMNEYVSICQSYNGSQIKEGDFIQICLEPNEETNILMPEKDDIEYKISLKFYNETENENHSILFNNNSEEYISLNKNRKDHKSKWNYSTQKQMTIKNNGNSLALIFLRISVYKSSFIIISASEDELVLKPNTLYGLYLPAISRAIGAYQELFLSKDIDNLCIFHDGIADVLFTLPPKMTCKKYNKTSFEFNYTSNNVYYDEEQPESFYTFIYYTKNDTNESDIKLNYRHMITRDISNANVIKKTEDIIYSEIKGLTNDTNLLFLQVLKNDINNNTKIAVQKYIDQGRYRFYEEYETLESKTKLAYSKFIKFRPNKDTGKFDKYVLKFYGTSEYVLFTDLGSSDDKLYTFDYLENNKLNLTIEKGKEKQNRYKIVIKPLEANGTANYLILAYPTPDSYSIRDLKKPSYILTHNDVQNVTIENIQSINGEFSEEDKNKFYIELDKEINETYYIVVCGHKMKPSGMKFYFQDEEDKHDDKKEGESEDSNSALVIVLIIVGLLALGVILFFVYKKFIKAQSSGDIEKEITTSSPSQPLVDELK